MGHAFQVVGLWEVLAAEVVVVHGLEVEHLHVLVVHGQEGVDHDLGVGVRGQEEVYGLFEVDLVQVVVALVLVGVVDLHVWVDLGS